MDQYKKEVKASLIDAMAEPLDRPTFEGLSGEELAELFTSEGWIDSVTGCISGSYTMNSEASRESVASSGILFDEEFIDWIGCALAGALKDGPDKLDTLARGFALNNITAQEFEQLRDEALALNN